MRFVHIVGLTALTTVRATGSTVQCSACPPASSTPDIVTRSALPSTPCTAPPLTVISGGTGMPSGVPTSGVASPTGSGTPPVSTLPPVAGASNGHVSGAIALAVAAIYFL
ncbi:hypothetical protein ACCO45_002870 [Purpureocillium lilacinum]|uniref:Uncharacterized protein n=1 Tax=Purpureocillium lilacinum TaxID=33203 RepID=A0ACC4DZ61_PURLI